MPGDCNCVNSSCCSCVNCGCGSDPNRSLSCVKEGCQCRCKGTGHRCACANCDCKTSVPAASGICQRDGCKCDCKRTTDGSSEAAMPVLTAATAAEPLPKAETCECGESCSCTHEAHCPHAKCAASSECISQRIDSANGEPGRKKTKLRCPCDCCKQSSCTTCRVKVGWASSSGRSNGSSASAVGRSQSSALVELLQRPCRFSEPELNPLDQQIHVALDKALSDCELHPEADPEESFIPAGRVSVEAARAAAEGPPILVEEKKQEPTAEEEPEECYSSSEYTETDEDSSYEDPNFPPEVALVVQLDPANSLLRKALTSPSRPLSSEELKADCHLQAAKEAMPKIVIEAPQAQGSSKADDKPAEAASSAEPPILENSTSAPESGTESEKKSPEKPESEKPPTGDQ